MGRFFPDGFGLEMCMANSWGLGSAEADEDHVQLRRQLKERRRKKGKRKDHAGVIATQNPAIAAYLRGWLERQKPA